MKKVLVTCNSKVPMRTSLLTVFRREERVNEVKGPKKLENFQTNPEPFSEFF